MAPAGDACLGPAESVRQRVRRKPCAQSVTTAVRRQSDGRHHRGGSHALHQGVSAERDLDALQARST